MSCNAYTEREVEFIRENYSSMNTEEIARILNRPFRSIQYKANSLGLSKKLFRNDEIEFIKNNFDKMSCKEIAQALNRKHRSVLCKARQIGLYKRRIVSKKAESSPEEVWADIPGFEGYYMVSDFGNVKSLTRIDSNSSIKNGTVLRQQKTQFGYKRVALIRDNSRIYIGVHRLVAMAFIPNPDNLPTVNHKDENKENNRVENLEWCSTAYNNAYGTRRERFSESKSKPIIMMDLDYNSIKEFPSLKSITEEMGYDTGPIEKACYEYGGASHGCRWKWKYNSLGPGQDGKSRFNGLSNKKWRDRHGEQ